MRHIVTAIRVCAAMFAACAMALAPLGAWADVLYVDAVNGVDAPDYGYSSKTPVKTIQRAVDMASEEGDTIVVAPGTYAPFSAWSHKGIAIKSTGGAAKTIVDGEGKERCATFKSSYTMTIEGFTLVNGHATKDSPGDCSSDGGGVCYATVKNCVISDCIADGSGGGAYGCEIYNTRIRNNVASGCGGGIDRCDYAINCRIYGNKSYGDGGGVHDTELFGCVVSNNVAVALGGGIEQYGNYMISNCTICCNTAFAGGGAFTYGGTFWNCDIYGNEATATSSYFGPVDGGISMSYSMTCGGGGVSGSNWGGGRSYAVFYNCKIHDNKAVRGGGALFERLYGCHVYGNSATFGGGGYSLWAFNSIIEKNTAENNGGGVLGGGLYNCTVTKNTAGIDGGGVYTDEEQREVDIYSVSCYNTIVYGNAASSNVDSADGYLGYWYNSCVGYLYSDIETVKTSVIFKNPKFVNADKGDYRLSADSPCINKGDNSKVETEVDYAGSARIVGGTVDIGAYEYAAKFTVKFNLNGVSGAVPAARTIVEDHVVGKLPSVKEPSGKMFLGWYTTKSGGTKVSAQTKVTGNMTLYAHWAAAWTVTWNANGGKIGSATTSKVLVQKGKAVGTLPKATRKGYKFKGWYTKKSGGTKIKTTTKITKSVTYYAQWTANKYTIKFNKNGGKGTMKTQSATYGKNVTLRANAFTKAKYKFAGWATKKNGKVAYKNKAKVKNLTDKDGKTVTLYAVWNKVKSGDVKAAAKPAASAARPAAAVAVVPAWAVGTFYGGDEGAFTTITVSKAGKVSGKVLFEDGGRWTIVGKAAGQRLETVVTDAGGNSAEVVFAIGKTPDGRCRIESEDGSISAEN